MGSPRRVVLEAINLSRGQAGGAWRLHSNLSISFIVLISPVHHAQSLIQRGRIESKKELPKVVSPSSLLHPPMMKQMVGYRKHTHHRHHLYIEGPHIEHATKQEGVEEMEEVISFRTIITRISPPVRLVQKRWESYETCHRWPRHCLTLQQLPSPSFRKAWVTRHIHPLGGIFFFSSSYRNSRHPPYSKTCHYPYTHPSCSGGPSQLHASPPSCLYYYHRNCILHTIYNPPPLFIW